MRLIYNSIIDTQSQLQHATNARLHTNGKNSPFSHPPKFPYKGHGDSPVSLKRGTENGVAEKGKADKAKAKPNLSEWENHSEDTKAENLVSHILQSKENFMLILSVCINFTENAGLTDMR